MKVSEANENGRARGMAVPHAPMRETEPPNIADCICAGYYYTHFLSVFQDGFEWVLWPVRGLFAVWGKFLRAAFVCLDGNA